MGPETGVCIGQCGRCDERCGRPGPLWPVRWCTLSLQAMRRILPVLGALLWVACGSPVDVTAPVDVTIQVGKPFPYLILPTLEDGKPSSIVQFRGKKTLLHVFASW